MDEELVKEIANVVVGRLNIRVSLLEKKVNAIGRMVEAMYDERPLPHGMGRSLPAPGQQRPPSIFSD